MSSPASVLGENDRRVEALTNSGEGANQTERRCEHGREKRTESLLCAKGKTQLVTEGSSKNVKDRHMEKNAPEQGCGQFPLRQPLMVVKGLVSHFHVRAPFLSQQHMRYQTACSPAPG